MRPRTTFIVCLLESVLISAGGWVLLVCVGFAFAWGDTGGSLEIETVVAVASAVWLNIHGVGLAIGGIVGVERLLGTGAQVQITLVALGFTLIILWLAFRAGRRVRNSWYLWPGWASGVAAYLVCGALITKFGLAALPSVSALGWLMPGLVYALGLVAGSLIGSPQFEPKSEFLVRSAEKRMLARLADRAATTSPWLLKVLWPAAWRVGVAVMLGQLLIAAVLAASSIVVNWLQVVNNYENLRVNLAGGLLITAAQLGLLPNLVVWLMAWLTGGGFYFGQDQLITPLVGGIQPVLPELPITSAISWLPGGGLIWLLVPAGLALITTLIFRKSSALLRYELAAKPFAALLIAGSAAIIATIGLGVLGLLASGSLWIGRWQVVGLPSWQAILAQLGLVFAGCFVASMLLKRGELAF